MLYEHQRKILADDPKKCGLFLGTGGGKTRVALELAEGSTLVICPKQQKLDRTWELNAEKFDIIINLKVISKEEFRRDWEKLPAYDTVIGDEAHTLFGYTTDTRQKNKIEIPKVSQTYQAVESYLKKYPPKRLYFCSATPVTKPMHLYAIAKLFGKEWDYLNFRKAFYFPKKIGFRTMYIPFRDEARKAKMTELVKKFGYTGQLSDFFDVPDQTHKVVKVDLTPEQVEARKNVMKTEADPFVKRSKIRTIENGVMYGKAIKKITDRTERLIDHTTVFPSQKIDYILERAQEFPKMLIFANYTAQINEISSKLAQNGFKVVKLTGETKDRSTLIADADEAPACIVVAQTAISAGYELPTFPCVIFASKSYRYVDYEQALGRVLRANALKKNLYIHLVVRDGIDETCHQAIMSGQDFQERLMAE
ncbi:MAG: helicase-related protein [Patescibacteria group bacterium]